MPTCSVETIQINYIFLTIFLTHSWLSPWTYNPTIEDSVNHNGVPTGSFWVCLASWPWLPLTPQTCQHACFYSHEAYFLPFLKLQIQSCHHWLLPGPSKILSLEESSPPSSKSAQMTLPHFQKHLQGHSISRQFKISRHLFKFSSFFQTCKTFRCFCHPRDCLQNVLNYPRILTKGSLNLYMNLI